MDQEGLIRIGDFTIDQLKRFIPEKKEYATEEKILNKLKKDALRVINEVFKEIERLEQIGVANYVRSYPSKTISLGASEGEDWELFDAYVNPRLGRDRQFRILILEKLGFAVSNDPPFSLDEPDLQTPRELTGNRVIFYSEAPAIPGVYLVRTVEKRVAHNIFMENLVYVPSEQALREMLIPRTPARV